MVRNYFLKPEIGSGGVISLKDYMYTLENLNFGMSFH